MTSNKGLSLSQLAQEIERQRTTKRDFVVGTRDLTVEPDDNSPTKLTLKVGAVERFPVRPHAVRQIGSQLGIPAIFVDRLAAKHPDMLAWNVNQLFHREPVRRLVRTLDGNARAYLSDNYRPLDNYDFANEVLTKLMNARADVSACDITENRLYIKAVVPGIERQVAKPGVFFGDGGHNPIHTFKPGICLSNSETGAGSLSVQPGVHEVACSNLAIFASNSMKKYHVGGRLAEGDDVQELYSDATKAISDRAFWAKVGDLVAAGLNGTLFDKMVAELEAKMAGKEIERPTEAIRELPNLTATEQEGILASLIRGGDLSQFGMQWAITHYAQNDAVSFERQVELERLGGEIIELPRTQWQRIAEAA